MTEKQTHRKGNTPKSATGVFLVSGTVAKSKFKGQWGIRERSKREISVRSQRRINPGIPFGAREGNKRFTKELGSNR